MSFCDCDGFLIGVHECCRTGSLANSNFLLARHAHVKAHIPVPVRVLDQVFEFNPHRCACSRQLSGSSSSQGLRSSLSGKASKASSRRYRSQTTRLLIVLGAGILLSLTIWSKRLGDIPIYAAAWVLDNP